MTLSSGCWLALTAALVGGLAHVRSLDNAWAYDDKVAVRSNPDVVGGRPYWDMVSHDFWGNPLWRPKDDVNAGLNWWSHLSFRPLTVLTFRLNYDWNGPRLAHDPFVFHATNVLVQMAACAAVVPLLTALTGAPDAASPGAGSARLRPTALTAVAAVLFAVHPIHVESVANVTHRAEPLCAVFLFLAYMCYERAAARATTTLGAACGFAAAAALHLTALAAKETAVVFPAVVVVVDVASTMLRRRAAPPGVKPRQSHAALRGVVEVPALTDAADALARPGLPLRAAACLVWAALVYYARVVVLTGGYALNMQDMHNPISSIADPLGRAASVAHVQALAASLLVAPLRLAHEHNAIEPVASALDPRNLHTLFVWLCMLALLAWAAASGAAWQGESPARERRRGAEAASPSADLLPRPVRCRPVGSAGPFSALPTQPPGHVSRRWRLLGGIGVAVVSYLPASHLLVRVGFVLAERQLYLSTIGAAVVLAEVLCGLAELAGGLALGRAGRWSGLEVEAAGADGRAAGAKKASRQGAAERQGGAMGKADAFEGARGEEGVVRDGGRPGESDEADGRLAPGERRPAEPPSTPGGEPHGSADSAVVASPWRRAGRRTVTDKGTSTAELERRTGLWLPPLSPSPGSAPRKVRFGPDQVAEPPGRAGRAAGRGEAGCKAKTAPRPAASREQPPAAVKPPPLTLLAPPPPLASPRPRLAAPAGAALWTGALLLASAFAALTLRRTPAWRSDLTLGEDLLRTYPRRNPMALYGAGTVRLYARQPDRAAPFLLRSLPLSPFAEPRVALAQIAWREALPAVALAAAGPGADARETAERAGTRDLFGGPGVVVSGVSGAHWHLPSYDEPQPTGCDGSGTPAEYAARGLRSSAALNATTVADVVDRAAGFASFVLESRSQRREHIQVLGLLRAAQQALADPAAPRLFREPAFPGRDPTSGPDAFQGTQSLAHHQAINASEYHVLMAQAGTALPPAHATRHALALNAGVVRVLSSPHRWGHLGLGRELLEKAASHGGSPVVRRAALANLGCLAIALGDAETAIRHLLQSLEPKRPMQADDEEWGEPMRSALAGDAFLVSDRGRRRVAEWAASQEGQATGPHLAYRAEESGCRFVILPIRT